jgi:signal transduction histidine kinase
MRHTQNGKITVGIRRSEKTQTVTVADTGEGMDAETARVVLKSYVSSKTDYWRHGIGLNVCRKVVAAHGGELWIESEKGRGAAIHFTLGEGPGDA